MRILAIESSCDETAFAIMDFEQGACPEIRAEAISSQVKIHRPYGGVVPELAAREHMRNLPLLLEQVLRDAAVDLNTIEVIGVTKGPGLKGCLLMGFCFARGLAQALSVPIVGVNHIEGHILAPMLENKDCSPPFLALVVSGGHTEIVAVSSIGEYRVLARTIDDAAGEAFDKSAHLLGFSYPGGPSLAALADTVESSDFRLPKVMREADGFSFSGLKTAIRLLIEKQGEMVREEKTRAALAHAIQDSIVDSLLFKLRKAIQETGIQRIVVTGGVSANKCLRREVAAIEGAEVYFPAMRHCMDNAAMIGLATYYRYLAGERLASHDQVVSRWPVETLQGLPAYARAV